MINRKSPIHLREILITIGVAIVMLVLGGLFDRQLTEAVYDPVRTNIFGIACTGFTELPVILALLFGAEFCFLSIKGIEKKLYKVILIILAVGATGFALYYTMNIWMEMAEFSTTLKYNPETTGWDPTLLILGIVFELAIVTLVVLFGVFKAKNFDKIMMAKVGFTLIILCLAVAVIGTGVKFIASRPRPNFIIASNHDNSLAGFRPFWEWHPFQCLKAEHKSYFMSFPSGHCMYASIGMFALPIGLLLSDKTKDNRKVQIIAYYCALVWTLVTAISRVVAGCHFLSDTAASLIVVSIIGLVLNYVVFRPKKEVEVNE